MHSSVLEWKCYIVYCKCYLRSKSSKRIKINVPPASEVAAAGLILYIRLVRPYVVIFKISGKYWFQHISTIY